MYLKAGGQKDNYNPKSEDGIWYGVKDESRENIIGLEDGVIKTANYERHQLP